MKKKSLVYLVSLLILTPSAAFCLDDDDLFSMNLEELMQMEVTSVSKKKQNLSDSAAAIFVITTDDIKRSGVTSIPDALRMAPGINVGQIDSNKWAITSRGFNGRFSNKLLVLIDGRTVYSPTFSGVYWEVQDTMLEDIERIEVIRGPGAALWGANAVNGVINIITKHAADTQNGLAAAGVGTHEKVFGQGRYGVSFNDTTHARIYAKGFKRDSFGHSTGGDADDDWDMGRTGFRVDSQLSAANLLTVHGDIFKGDIDQTVNLVNLPPANSIVHDDAETQGWNMVTSWQHTLSATSELQLQLYYDHFERDEVFLDENRDIINIDFHHRFGFGQKNDIIYGLGYHYTSDNLQGFPYMTYQPSNRYDEVFSGFIHDEITLLSNLWLTLGAKCEHNDYTGSEVKNIDFGLPYHEQYAPHPGWSTICGWQQMCRPIMFSFP